MKKICVVLLSSALIIALLCQPAFALLYTRSSTKWVLGNSFGGSKAFLTSNDTIITSYDEWCDFYPEICDAVADGYYSVVDSETSLDKGTQRKTTENELPSLTQCTA